MEMVVACFALGCTARAEKGSPYTFHRIPRNRELAMQWLKALGREDTEYSRIQHIKICSRHFDPYSFIYNQRGKSLIRGTLPTLNLGLEPGGRSVLNKEGKKVTRRLRPLTFKQYSEELIKKSPREALRAFRLAKQTIHHNNKRIKELSDSQRNLRKKLMKVEIQVDKMSTKMKKELGLNFNLPRSFAYYKQKKEALLVKPGRNPETNNETDPVKIKEEPLSESEEGPKHSEFDEEPTLPDSESGEEPKHSKFDKEPTLPDSESDSSDLMDEDEWAQTFQEDSEEEALGIPIQGGLNVDNASIQMPVIKSVSSLSDGPVPVMLSNGTSPVLTTPPCRCAVMRIRNAHGLPFRIAKSTQTAIVDLVEDSKDESGPTDDDDLEDQNFDRFGTFVAKRLNALSPRMGRFLQNEFGTLMYKVERGIIRCPPV